MKLLSLLVLIAAFALPLAFAGQGTAGCTPAGNVQYVCGQQAPEDLIVIPNSEWVLASSMAGSGGVRLINVRDKSSTVVYPSATSKDRLDAKTYDSCPGVPEQDDKAKFVTHGLALRQGRN